MSYEPRPRPRPVRTVLDEQKAVAERDRQPRQASAAKHAADNVPPAKPATAVVPATPAPSLPAPTRDEAAFERNLSAWGSGGGTPLTPNGLEGGFQTSGSEKIDVDGILFVAHLDETRKEWIRLREGEPPITIGIAIYEDAALPRRYELGDTDPAEWPLGKFSNEPADPYQLQFRCPLVSTATSGEIFELTSRSATALYAFQNLLNRYGRHPQRKKGLLPLLQLETTTYFNKRLGTNKPKPDYRIVGWVEKDGGAPKPPTPLITSGPSEVPFDDSIPF